MISGRNSELACAESIGHNVQFGLGPHMVATTAAFRAPRVNAMELNRDLDAVHPLRRILFFLRLRGRRSGGFKPVADPRIGMNVLWMGGVRLDLLPELVDEYTQVFGFIAIVRTPDRLQQSAVFKGFTLIRHQLTQQFEFLRRQPDRAALDEDLSPFEINFQIARNIRGHRFCGGCAPQGRADAREQLFHAEGLGHVIIGAGIERQHFVVFRVAHSEHDNGYVRLITDFAAGLQSSDSRHIDVQEYEFRAFLPQNLQGHFPAARFDDRVSIA
jgi:hypothetical protein